LSKIVVPGSGGDDESETDEKEEEAEAPAIADPNAFIVDPKLIDTAGGGPKSLHPPDTSKMGRFTYKEFDSIETLFEYA